MAVTPERLLALGRPSLVEEALLSDEDVRALGFLTAPDRVLRGRDLFERSAEMEGRRPCASLGGPWDGPVESPVDLEDSRPVAIAPQGPRVATGQTVTRNAEDLPGSDVEQGHRCLRQLVDGLDLPTRLDLSAERTQVRHERVGEPLRPAPDQRPSVSMPEESQYEPERRGRDAVQILNRVRGEPGEERPRPLPVETLG